MKNLNVFFTLILMVFFAISCAPGIKYSNNKTVKGEIGTSPAEMEGLSKAEMRSANAGLTRSVATMIDSATKNPTGYQEWQTIIVALTELTKNPDEEIRTHNQNRNHSIATNLNLNNSKSNSSKSKITQISGFYKSGQYYHPSWDTKGLFNYSKDEAMFLSNNPTCDWAKKIEEKKYE